MNKSVFRKAAGTFPALLAALMTLCLCACVPGLNPGPPPTRLQLAPAMPSAVTGSPINKQLIVAMPLAGRELDGDAIALIFGGREIRYLAGARWTGSVPFLLQRQLISAIEATGALRGVGDDITGLAANARLLTDVRQFGLQYASEDAPPTAVFEADFRLLDLNTGKIMGSRRLAARAPASGRDNAALAEACEKALEKTLADVSAWVVNEMRRLK